MVITPRARRILKIVGFAAFYLFALIVFAYVTFPYERLRDRIVQEFNARQTGPDAMRLEIDDLDAYWLSGVEAEGIRLIPSVKPQPAGALESGEAQAPVKPRVMNVDSARVRVGLLGLLFGSTRLNFGADAFGGNISGSTLDSDGTRSLDVEIEDVSLADAPILADVVGLPMTGTMNGELELRLPEGKLAKAEGIVKLKVDGLGVGDGKAKINRHEHRATVERAATRKADAPLSAVKLEAPVPRPGKILAIGLNYADHIAESGQKTPEQQVWFCKHVDLGQRALRTRANAEGLDAARLRSRTRRHHRQARQARRRRKRRTKSIFGYCRRQRRHRARLAVQDAAMDAGQVLRHARPVRPVDRHGRRDRRPARARHPRLRQRREAPGARTRSTSSSTSSTRSRT